jgi:hypothetical protein
MEPKSKYTKQILEEAVAKSVSYAGILRELGLKQTGGSQRHIKELVTRYNIDVSHFTGQGHLRGQSPGNRRSAAEVLIYREGKLTKEKRPILLRALEEIGREYRCECGQGPEWQGKELDLQIDHINGDNMDNRAENIRTLCPNCHSQTPTFGSRNKAA